jgi:hypothetical protein
MPSFTSINNNPNDSAILATSNGEGLHATSSSTGMAAVAAYQLDTTATSSGAAVFGETRGGGAAVVALQTNAQSGGSGVFAECRGTGHGVHAKLNNPNGAGAALFAEHIGDKTAGHFKGNVIVTGDVSFPGMDCAEEFVVAESAAVEPGTLMTIGKNGVLEPSASAYDRKIVGVVAGAADLKPGIIMGKGQHGTQPARPIALVGRAYCKADAAFGAIELGDLLTSSPRPGHAMKASDPSRAFGAVIGKAMAPLDEGDGLVPILIALQ